MCAKDKTPSGANKAPIARGAVIRRIWVGIPFALVKKGVRGGNIEYQLKCRSCEDERPRGISNIS